MNTRWTSFAAIAGLALALGALPAQAGWDADLRTGFYTDAEEAFLGGGLLTNLQRAERWYFNPNLELVLDDRRDLVTLNADFHYDFATPSPNSSLWLGGGPAVIHRDFDGLGDETDLGLNLVGGFGRTEGKIRPFAQAKFTFADDNEATLAVGVRF